MIRGVAGMRRAEQENRTGITGKFTNVGGWERETGGLQLTARVQ